MRRQSPPSPMPTSGWSSPGRPSRRCALPPSSWARTAPCLFTTWLRRRGRPLTWWEWRRWRPPWRGAKWSLVWEGRRGRGGAWGCSSPWDHGRDSTASWGISTRTGAVQGWTAPQNPTSCSLGSRSFHSRKNKVTKRSSTLINPLFVSFDSFRDDKLGMRRSLINSCLVLSHSKTKTAEVAEAWTFLRRRRYSFIPVCRPGRRRSFPLVVSFGPSPASAWFASSTAEAAKATERPHLFRKEPPFHINPPAKGRNPGRHSPQQGRGRTCSSGTYRVHR